nr:immunoglobulin heavy chain junction region [Mus musculus]
CTRTGRDYAMDYW